MNKLDKATKYVLSPIKTTVLVLIVWTISLGLATGIITLVNALTPQFKSVNIVIIVLIFSGISAAIGIPLSLFLTSTVMNMFKPINSALEKLVTGDFETEIKYDTNNAYFTAISQNFNKIIKELNSISVLRNGFISDFSHEIKTPLYSINGYAELLSDSENLTPQQLKYINIIIEESARLNSLAANILSINKLESQTILTEKTTFSLDEQLAEVILLLDNTLRQKELDLDTSLQKIIINADKNMLREVWINLLHNAVKFTESNGTITVTAQKEGGFCQVSVEDTGIGIDENTQKYIFDKYYQLSKIHGSGGAGIGLAIAKKIVELSGGTISVKSTPDAGSKFTVTLPLS